MSTITESPSVESPPAGSSPVVVTPEDLLEMPDGWKYELVNGRLVEKNVSGLSSLVAAEVGRRLGNHNETIGSPGWIFGPDMGYQCFPDRPNLVRKPDVSYVPRGWLNLEDLQRGFLRVPPALAVEVVSPNDIAETLEIKVEEYFSAGVRLVWIIYPTSKTAHLFRLDGSAAKLRVDDHLNGEDFLPGFECRVSDLIPAAS